MDFDKEDVEKHFSYQSSLDENERMVKSEI